MLDTTRQQMRITLQFLVCLEGKCPIIFVVMYSVISVAQKRSLALALYLEVCMQLHKRVSWLALKLFYRKLLIAGVCRVYQSTTYFLCLVIFLVGLKVVEVAHDIQTSVASYVRSLKLVNSYDTWHGECLLAFEMRTIATIRNKERWQATTDHYPGSCER